MTVVLAALAVAAGAATQSVTGFGSSLVAAPFLVALWGAGRGVRTAIVFSAIVNVLVLLPERRTARPRDALLLLVPALAATPVFAVVVRRADPGPLAIAAGALTIAAAALLAAGMTARRLRGAGGAIAAGVTSAGMNLVAGIGGPAAALHAINVGWPPQAVRPTLQIYFLALNITGLALIGLPPLEAWLPVAVLAGWAAGTVAARRVPPAAVRTASLVLSAGGGAAAIWRGFAG